MLTTLGMILLGFAGISAAFLLFVFMFGDLGTFVKLTTDSTPVLTTTSFPYKLATGTSIASGTTLTLELTNIGMIFIYGGMFAAALVAMMFFICPWCALDKPKMTNFLCNPACNPPVCG